MNKLTAIFALTLGILPFSSFAIRGDYTGDGKADLAIASVNVNAGSTTWKSFDLSNSATTTLEIPAAADAFVPGDYNGDGKTDPAVVYVKPEGTLEWHTMIDSVDNVEIFGANGDRPIAGDFDCDGKDDKAVIRRSGDRFVWYFKLSSGTVYSPAVFGRAGDQFYTARVTSTSCDRLVLSRVRGAALQWYHRTPTNPTFSFVEWGTSTDQPIPPADTNGDGLDEFIYERAVGSAASAIVRLPDNTSTTHDVGLITDTPLVGKFSGEDAAEFAYYRPGVASASSTFYLGEQTYSFGSKQSVLIRPDGSVVQPGEGSDGACGNTVSIDAVSYILYKPSNLHGGRGPTFLVQNPSERTGLRRLKIKDANCKVISYFGLYRTDNPYGSRYYQKSGGSGHSAAQLLRLAKKAGSTAIFVEGKNNRWIKVNNPNVRQGAVHN